MPLPHPAIAAHRGGAGLWPENSRLAFQSSLDLAIEDVHLDVHLTADDRLVVIHDPTLDRTTTGRGPVRRHRYDDLGDVRLRWNGESLPLLSEVLDILRPSRLGLHIVMRPQADGTSYPAIERRLLAALDERGLVPRAQVASFDFDALATLRGLDSEIRLCGNVNGRTLERFGGYSGCLARLKEMAATAISVRHTVLTDAAAELAHANGFAVQVWTVSAPGGLRQWLAAPIESVNTARPDLALAMRNNAFAAEAAVRFGRPAGMIAGAVPAR